MSQLAAIVLAAGGSTRMGQPKPLLEWKGASFLEHTIRNLQRAGVHEVIVVLGSELANCEEIATRLGARAVFNPDWKSGVASSVRAGLAAFTGVDAALFALVDQLAIPISHYAALCRHHREQLGRIFASAYGGSLGVPAIFPAAFFPDLLALSGDQGAKRLLFRYPDRVTGIPCAEAEFDCDTPDEFHRFASAS